MGGHLLLRALAEKAMSPDAAVLIAPMLGMNSGPLLAAWCARISRLMCVLGDPARMPWNNAEKPGVSPSLPQALLTHRSGDSRGATALVSTGRSGGWHHHK